MRGTQLAVLLVVALLLVPAPVLGVVRGSPDLDVSLSERTLTAGEETKLTLTIANSGDLEKGSAANPSLNSKVTTARAVDVTLKKDDAPVSVKSGTQTLGSLPEGGSAPLGYRITVNENAKPGTYTMEATVKYTYTSVISEQSGVQNTKTEKRTFDVTVKIEDRAQFEIVDTSTDIRAGSTGTIDVTMQNTGSEVARDTTVSLQSQNTDIAFGQSSSSSRYAGRWEPGETKTISYQATATQGAETQRYAFTATANFDDGDGITRKSQPLSLGVVPGSEQQFAVVETTNTASVGDTGTLSVTMENTGSISVNDATVTLQSQSSDIVFGESASSTRFVGEWAPGEQRTVEYDLTATESADTRSYALSATVTYDDQNDNSGTSRPLSLGVTPEPETEFTLSNVSTTLQVGKEGKLRGTVTNQGETTVRDAVLQFTTQGENINPTDREYSIGTLKPGESAEFQFTVEITEAAQAGPRQFAFVTEYRNSEGETRKSDDLLTRQQVATERKTFELSVTKATLKNGKTSELQVNVTNRDDETLSDISAKLFADAPISADDSEAFIKELQPGESQTITFTVSASGANVKKYPVSVDFQYDDADGDTLVSDTYPVAVTVEEKESRGGGFPLTIIGVGAAVVIIGFGSYKRYLE